MKKNFYFIVALFLLYLAAYNPTDNLLFTFQFVAQGSAINPFSGELYFSIYNTLFNIAMIVLFVSRICKGISDAFTLHPYIFCRGGQVAVKRVMLKRALIEISLILLAKLILYIPAFVISRSFSTFFFYDFISTFLTLSLFAFIFILCKLSGVKDKIPLFCLISGHMIALILSYQLRFFSIFTIASIDWQNDFWFTLPIKFLIIVAIMYFLLSKKNGRGLKA